jgi:hypothetical protein
LIGLSREFRAALAFPEMRCKQFALGLRNFFHALFGDELLGALV